MCLRLVPFTTENFFLQRKMFLKKLMRVDGDLSGTVDTGYILKVQLTGFCG